MLMCDGACMERELLAGGMALIMRVTRLLFE